MSIIVRLDDYRKPSEARPSAREAIRTLPTKIDCNSCNGVEMIITDVTDNIMTVKCSDCGVSRRYDTGQTMLLIRDTGDTEL